MSKKQELVTLSTAEAEYVAAMHAVKEGVWLRHFVEEVFQLLANPTILYCDNQAAIALTKDGSFHAHTKHIDIRYHFIRFVVNSGSILLLKPYLVLRRSTSLLLLDYIPLLGEC